MSFVVSLGFCLFSRMEVISEILFYLKKGVFFNIYIYF